MRYKRKPEVIEAMQLQKDNREAVLKWMGDVSGILERRWDPVNIMLKTIEEPIDGQLLIPGDYVIKHAAGVFSIVPRDRFEMDYEKEVVK